MAVHSALCLIAWGMYGSVLFLVGFLVCGAVNVAMFHVHPTGEAEIAMAREYVHDGQTVEAMRFVGNGADFVGWAGPAKVRAAGRGLMGTLSIDTPNGPVNVEPGDWVVRSGRQLAIVSQEKFVCRYREADMPTSRELVKAKRKAEAWDEQMRQIRAAEAAKKEWPALAAPEAEKPTGSSNG